MEIQLERLSDDPFEWQEELTIPPKELEHPDLRAISQIAQSGRLDVTGDGYLLRNQMAYRQTVGCIRCLEEIEMAIEADSTYLVLINSAEDEAVERELEAEELGLIRLAEPVLDTRPLAVEQVQLNVPMKPLCRKDCAGLCSSCGADLNDGPCGCKPAIDPRWAALQGLGGSESS